jgi:hypothetical protein
MDLAPLVLGRFMAVHPPKNRRCSSVAFEAALLGNSDFVPFLLPPAERLLSALLC